MASWHGSPLSPFICAPLSLPAGFLGGQVHLFPFVSLTGSFVSFCLPGAGFWVDGFMCLSLSPFICLPFFPSLDAWRNSLEGRVRLSRSGWTNSFVLPLSPAWMPGMPSFASRLAQLSGAALWVDGFNCLPFFRNNAFISLPLSADSFVCLCLPFISCCFPARMPLPLSPFWVDGLSPALRGRLGDNGSQLLLV